MAPLSTANHALLHQIPYMYPKLGLSSTLYYNPFALIQSLSFKQLLLDSEMTTAAGRQAQAQAADRDHADLLSSSRSTIACGLYDDGQRWVPHRPYKPCSADRREGFSRVDHCGEVVRSASSSASPALNSAMSEASSALVRSRGSIPLSSARMCSIRLLIRHSLDSAQDLRHPLAAKAAHLDHPEATVKAAHSTPPGSEAAVRIRSSPAPACMLRRASRIPLLQKAGSSPPPQLP